MRKAHDFKGFVRLSYPEGLLYNGVRIILTYLVGHNDIKGMHINNSDVSLKVLTLRIGNHPGVLNPSPSVETVQVRFICAHPASMLVTPVYKVAAGTQPCPLPQYNKQLVSADCPDTHGSFVSNVLVIRDLNYSFCLSKREALWHLLLILRWLRGE